jgi:hypothetical protein
VIGRLLIAIRVPVLSGKTTYSFCADDISLRDVDKKCGMRVSYSLSFQPPPPPNTHFDHSGGSGSVWPDVHMPETHSG